MILLDNGVMPRWNKQVLAWANKRGGDVESIYLKEKNSLLLMHGMLQLSQILGQANPSRFVSFHADKLRYSEARDAFESETLFSWAFVISVCAGLMAGVLILLACPSSGFCDRSSENQKIIIVFRYDDYSAVSPVDCDLKIIDTFRQIGATVSLGVIPFITTDYEKHLSTVRLSENDSHSSEDSVIPLTPAKVRILTDAVNEGVVDVAMHGYSHRSFKSRRRTEFCGLDFETQFDHLSKGKEFLEQALKEPITCFVPPWNSYDKNTLRSLGALGFASISGSKLGADAPSEGFKFLPATSSLERLPSAIAESRKFHYKQPVIVCVFHPLDFREVDKDRGVITFSEFSGLINTLAAQDDISVLSLSQAMKAVDAGVEHFRSNKRITILSAFVPAQLRSGLSDLYLTQSTELSHVMTTLTIFYFIIFLLLSLSVILCKKWVFPRLNRVLVIIIHYGVLAAFLGSALLAVRLNDNILLWFVVVFIGFSIIVYVLLSKLTKSNLPSPGLRF